MEIFLQKMYSNEISTRAYKEDGNRIWEGGSSPYKETMNEKRTFLIKYIQNILSSAPYKLEFEIFALIDGLVKLWI